MTDRHVPKRLIQFRNPDDISQWWGTLGTLWRVVAIDVQRGEVTLEHVQESDVPPRTECSAS